MRSGVRVQLLAGGQQAACGSLPDQQGAPVSRRRAPRCKCHAVSLLPWPPPLQDVWVPLHPMDVRDILLFCLPNSLPSVSLE